MDVRSKADLSWCDSHLRVTSNCLGWLIVQMAIPRFLTNIKKHINSQFKRSAIKALQTAKQASLFIA